jgi:dienelactone hydrolase
VAEIVLFHHAHGLTDGVRDLGARLRAAGHDVHLPDLYDARCFDELEAGVAHAESIGMERIAEAGARMVDALPARLVYVGFSLGVLPAQRLAQTRAGAAGAVLCHSGLPLGVFADAWPDGVPLQLHVMADDPWGDVDDVRALAAAVPGAELHLYPGDAHLFADPSLPSHDPDAAELLVGRMLTFLDQID